MIIEIKNLPEGRKLKHINVDVSFEEDGIAGNAGNTGTASFVQQVTTGDFWEGEKTVNYPKKEAVEDAPKDTTKEDTQESDSLEIAKPVIKERTVKKDIPAEMTDMEF